MSATDDLLAELCEAGRRDAPPEGAREHGLAPLEAAVASGVAPIVDAEQAHPLAEAWAGSSATGVVLKVLALAVVVGAGATAVVASRDDDVTPAATDETVVSRPVEATAPEVDVEDDPPPPVLEQAASPSPPDPLPPPRAEPRTRSKERPRRLPEPAEPARDFTEETRILTRAWAAIRRGDHRGALELAAEHERRFPRGMLVEEREASRAVAECGLGGPKAARARDRFLTRFPGSVHVSRVRSTCPP